MKNFVKIDPSVSRFLDAAGLWDGLMGLPEPTRTTMLGAVSIALNADREAVRAEALFEALHAVTELPDPTDSTDRDIGESIGLAKAQRAVQRLHTAAMKRIPAPPKEGTWLK